MESKTIADRIYLNGKLVDVKDHICYNHEEDSDNWVIDGHHWGWHIYGEYGELRVYLQNDRTTLLVVGRYDEINVIAECTNRGSIRHNLKINECKTWEEFCAVMESWEVLFPEGHPRFDSARKLKEQIEVSLWYEVQFDEWMRNGKLDCPPEFFNRGISYPYDENKYVQPEIVGNWPNYKTVYVNRHSCEFCHEPFVSKISMKEHQHKDHGLARV